MDNKPAPDRDPHDNAEFLAAVDEGVADADAMRMVSFAAVHRWLLSWRTEQEKARPI